MSSKSSKSFFAEFSKELNFLGDLVRSLQEAGVSNSNKKSSFTGGDTF